MLNKFLAVPKGEFKGLLHSAPTVEEQSNTG